MYPSKIGGPPIVSVDEINLKNMQIKSKINTTNLPPMLWVRYDNWSWFLDKNADVPKAPSKKTGTTTDEPTFKPSIKKIF